MGTDGQVTRKSGRREGWWILLASIGSIGAALTALMSIVDRGLLGAVPTGALLCVLALFVLPVPTLVLARRARRIEARRVVLNDDSELVECVVHARHDDRRAREHRVSPTTTRVHQGAA